MKATRRAFSACFLLVALLLFGAANAAAADKELVIGLIPETNIFQQMERFRPLGKYLSEQTGTNIRFSVLTRYGNLIENFQQHRLDGAFFGSFTGALAIQKLGVIPIARPVNLNGKSTYSGMIFVRKDSGIKTVADMRGKRFAFVEKATSAGYIFPLAYLAGHGVKNVNSFLGETYFTGSHDAAIYAVLQGKAAVGAAKDSVYEWSASRDPAINRDLQVLARSEEFPSNGLALRKDMDPALVVKLKTVLLHLHESPQGLKVLETLRAKRFIETRVEDYKPVFGAARHAGIDVSTYVFQND